MTSSVQGSERESGPRPPDFFLIGVPRGATTSLYYALRQHPQLFLPELKEACYACREFDAGLRRTQTRYIHDLSEYLQLFIAAAPDQLIGEGCIYNVYSARAPAEIRALNPGARLLIQLRDPVEQMYSNHALKVIMRDIAWDDFGHALDAQVGRRAGRRELPAAMTEYDLLDKATVSPGLARFIEAFGRDRIHVTLFEEYGADPLSVLESIFRFLDVDPDFRPRVDVHVPNRVARWDRLNRTMRSARAVGTAKRGIPSFLHPVARSLATLVFRANRRVATRAALDQQLRDRLRDEFRPEVERMGELVGRDLLAAWWPDVAASAARARSRRVTGARQG